MATVVELRPGQAEYLYLTVKHAKPAPLSAPTIRVALSTSGTYAPDPTAFRPARRELRVAATETEVGIYLTDLHPGTWHVWVWVQDDEHPVPRPEPVRSFEVACAA